MHWSKFRDATGMVKPEHMPWDERLKRPAQPEQGQLWGPTAACQGLGGVQKTEPEEGQRIQVERRGAEVALMKTFFLMRRARQWRRCPAGCAVPTLGSFPDQSG